jgi:hypothetical protein
LLVPSVSPPYSVFKVFPQERGVKEKPAKYLKEAYQDIRRSVGGISGNQSIRKRQILDGITG